MIYAWMAGIIIIVFVGFGTLFLMLNNLINKVDEYHSETLKNVEDAKPKSPFGRYDL